MLDRTSSPSKARLRDCRRDVLCLAGARLLAEMPAPPDDDRFSVMQSITTLVAQSALSSSREAAWLDHVQDALKAISTRRKSQAIENAIAIVSAALESATAEAAFPSFLVPDEELAVAVLGVLVAAANSRLDSRVLPIVRRFPPRLRTQVTTLISAADGSINTDHADLLSAAGVGALDAAAFNAATGKGDLLKRMKLPQAAARIMPAGCGPISRFSAATFRRWSHDSQLLGLLDARSLQQRRQIELCSRIASATLADVRVSAATADAMIRWGLVVGSELPAGRFGTKYSKLVRWMTDSAASPRHGLRPRRSWTPKIAVQTAVAAATAHAEALRITRKKFSPVTLPDDPPGPNDQWPRGGALGNGTSLRRLWSLSTVQGVGKALDNCLAYLPAWGRRHQSGEAAIYAVEDGAEAIGAIAVGRDLIGALSIIEQGGPCNAPLPAIVQGAVQKWIGQANADSSRSA